MKIKMMFNLQKNKNHQIIKKNMPMENKKKILNNNSFGLIKLNLQIKMSKKARKNETQVFFTIYIHFLFI
jgi:hypothetical protein